MRHLVSIALFVAATVTFVLGLGPLYSGSRPLGVALIAISVGLEIAFWRRTRHRKTAHASPMAGR